MAENKNFFKVDGVLYSKNTRMVQGKKDPTKTYEFNSFILEIKSVYTYTHKETGIEKSGERVELVQFDAGQKVDLDMFNAGHVITVSFKLTGKEYPGKNGGGKVIFSKNYAYKVEFADLDASRPNHKGKVTVGAISSPTELDFPPTDDDDNLPF